MSTVTNVCFHGVGVPDRDLEPGEDAYWIGHSEFLRILDELAEHPEVRISFDDGNTSDVEIALPALVERRLTATFFVVAGRLEQRGSLAGDHVRALADAGMEIGSHGMLHRPWRALSPLETHIELSDARAVLTEVCGRRVLDAALPMGLYDRHVLAELRRYGYRRVYTSDRARCGEHAWLQPRYSITSSDTVASVQIGRAHV